MAFSRVPTMLWLLAAFVYYVDANQNCGEVQTGRNGEIYYSKHLNRSVPELAECNWTIVANEEIFLTVEVLVLDETDDFSIFDESGNLVFGPFYGVHGVFLIATGLEKLTAVLTTSAAFRERAFSIKYTSGNCNYKEVNIVSAHITSPLYNPKLRKEALNCTYELSGFGLKKPLVLMAAEFSNVTLTKGLLRLTAGKGISEFNDASFLHRIFLKAPLNIVMSFKDSQVMEHFSLQLSLVSEDCSGLMVLNETKPMSRISFSQHPYLDDRSFARLKRSCMLVIQSPPGTHIRAAIKELSLPSVEDLLLLHNSQPHVFAPRLFTSVSTGGKNLKDASWILESNEIWVTFSTYHNREGLKANLLFSIHAPGYLHQNEGHFTINSSNEYRIQVESGKRVFVQMKARLQGKTTRMILYSSLEGGTESFLTISADSFPLLWIASPSSQLRLIVLDYDEPRPMEFSYNGTTEDCFSIGNGTSGSFALVDPCQPLCEWVIPPKDHHRWLLKMNSSKANVSGQMLTEQPNLYLTVNDVESFYEVSIPSFHAFLIRIVQNCQQPGHVQVEYTPQESCNKDWSLVEGETVRISSPGYPSRYPVNTRCHTRVSSKVSWIYVSFSQLKLASSHSLELKGLNESLCLSSDMRLPHDYLFPGTLDALLLGHPQYPSSDEPKFSFQATTLSCGGTLRDRKGIVTSSSNHCIWKIVIPRKSNSSKVHLRLIKGNWSGLSIYDGPSVHHPLLNFDREVTSSGHSVLLVYYSRSQTPTLQLVYESKECTDLCNNGHCMNEKWLCNGINECGDYSDELLCKVPDPSYSDPLPCIVSSTTMSLTTASSTITKSPVEESTDSPAQYSEEKSGCWGRADSVR